MTSSMGALFAGYDGIGLALKQIMDVDLAWYSEIDKHACTVLAAHHPGVPNLGDITTVDWAQVEPVDVLTGGFPCQPFSHAGKREGVDDERHLWPYCVGAIQNLRPRLAIFENVLGLLSIMEERDEVAGDAVGWGVVGTAGRPVRRLAFLTVLADLAAVGYDARWITVRAADAGAPHGRARIFITAYPHGSGRNEDVEQPSHVGASHGEGQPGVTDGHRADADAAFGLPAADAEGGRRGVGTRPPAATGGHEVEGTGDRGGIDWGKYAPAIHRWAMVLGRPAPSPTAPGANGRPRLSPAFVEWMMGLPAGHVTGHGLRPAQELKLLGNGVVPLQCALALRMLGVTP